MYGCRMAESRGVNEKEHTDADKNKILDKKDNQSYINQIKKSSSM
jgi:hypothetical protein